VADHRIAILANQLVVFALCVQKNAQVVLSRAVLPLETVIASSWRRRALSPSRSIPGPGRVLHRVPPQLGQEQGTKDRVRRCLRARIPVYLLDGDDADPVRITEVKPLAVLLRHQAGGPVPAGTIRTEQSRRIAGMILCQ
jgi:hypothetical protein